MPITDANTNVFTYPMSKRGVNLYKNVVDLHPEEAIFTQNCVWTNGMVKRGGSTKYETDEVSTGKKIIGLHRFYYGTSSKQTLVASGTVVKYHDGATWQNVKTGLTDGEQTYLTTWLDKAYIANGTDAPHTWNGAASAALAAAPATTTMFLPYQDRLLSITGGDLTWSGSFDPTTWETVANCGVRPDTHLYGMCHHSSTNISTGYEAKVLLAGANGMYLFSGTDLRTPSTTGDYSIFPLATKIGCVSPRTMVWTPKGTIYLGVDKQVYMLPFQSSTPIPIGHKITSNTYLAGVTGIEDASTSLLSNACAAYHDGYYKLSITPAGGTANTYQWWLDINRLYQDEEGLWGPWFGPMVGMAISCFAVQGGTGDSGELLGGESAAATGSYVYQLNQRGVYADDGTALQIYYQTFYHPLGAAFLRKDVHRVELELLNVLGTVNVDFLDIEGALKTGDTVSLSGNAVYWDDNYWDEDYWSSSMPTRQTISITPAIQPRRLSVLVKHSSSNDKFELYSISAEAIEQSSVFA